MSDFITVKFPPKIKLEEIKMKDYDYGGFSGYENFGKDIEKRGVVFPHVQINNYIFQPAEIIKMTIDQNDIIPRLYLKIIMNSTADFLSNSFPKDGDIVSIFIRGRDNLFKPIRNDYLITSVNSNSSGATQEGRFMTINIEGILYIPHLYDCENFAIDGTSYEVMENIAKMLDLGFATNEDYTNDNMKWICAYDNKLTFINNVCEHAWKDIDSFYTCFIDIYYNLNFVNVNMMIKDNGIVLDALAENTMSKNDYGESISKFLTKKCLTNHIFEDKSNFFIKSFRPINNSVTINKKYGYAFNVIFYDHDNRKKWMLQSTTLITKNLSDDKTVLRGRDGNDDYNNQQLYKYLGIHYSDNMHTNYIYASVHNFINNIELEKLYIEADLNKFNLNIYKYEPIPALFFITGDLMRMKKMNKDIDIEDAGDLTSDNANTMVIDRFYSGFYVVKGFSIEYNMPTTISNLSNFTEKLVLTRREWPKINNIN